MAGGDHVAVDVSGVGRVHLLRRRVEHRLVQERHAGFATWPALIMARPSITKVRAAKLGSRVAASHLLNLSGLIDDVVDGHLGGAGVQLDVFRVGVLDAIRQLME